MRSWRARHAASGSRHEPALVREMDEGISMAANMGWTIAREPADRDFAMGVEALEMQREKAMSSLSVW